MTNGTKCAIIRIHQERIKHKTIVKLNRQMECAPRRSESMTNIVKVVYLVATSQSVKNLKKGIDNYVNQKRKNYQRKPY